MNNTLLRSLLILTLVSLGLGLQAQECGVIYVTPSGASSGAAGTKANPASFSYGLSLIDADNRYLKIAVGTYTLTNKLEIEDSVIYEGGYLPAQNWAKTNAQATEFIRQAVNVEANPDRIVAFSAENKTGFRLQDIEIIVEDAPGNGVSNYGIYLNGCDSYRIVRTHLDIGKGSPGVDGVDGVSGSNGAPGVGGELGCRRCAPTDPDNNLGGAGGDSWSAGANAGGLGGNGGEIGNSTDCAPLSTATIPLPVASCYNNLCDPAVAEAPPGQDGTSGNGPGAGAFGQGKAGYCYCDGSIGAAELATDIIDFINTCPSLVDTLTYFGQPGTDGTDGTDGVDGTDGAGSFAGGFFQPEDGTDGTDGTDGSGGGGGGGGASLGCIPRLGNNILGPELAGVGLDETNSSGGGGGGGGEGGQRGTAGTAGTAGGSVFGVFIWDNGPGGLVKDCQIVVDSAGNGGNGGQGGQGGVGGQGGLGGNDYQQNGVKGSGCEAGAGGDGGDGGGGGDGGDGGDGSDGTRMRVFQQSTAPQAVVSNNYNPAEPDITVATNGCANKDIDIDVTTTAGVINWFLGGTNPSAQGTAVTTRYATEGFKTISVFTDGIPSSLTNFIYLNRPFDQPEILSDGSAANARSLCVGESLDFTTNSSASTYTWTFNGGTPASASTQNPGTVTFNTAGTYIVSLQLSTDCCGDSDIDSVVVNVVNTPSVTLPNDTTLCVTDTTPTLDAGGLADATYTWTVPTGVTASTDQFQNADSSGTYTVEVSYPGGCSATDDYVLTLIDSLDFDLGPDQSLCNNDPLPVLDPGLDATFTYNWLRNGNVVGVNPSLQTTLNGTYALTVISNTGCIGKDTLEITKTNPTVDLGEDAEGCNPGTPVVLDAQNPLASFEWFENGTLISGATNQTYSVQTTGQYAVTVTDFNGCTVSDTVDVTMGSPITAAIGGPTTGLVNAAVNFTDNSTPAGATDNWLWDFGTGDQSTCRTPTTLTLRRARAQSR